MKFVHLLVSLLVVEIALSSTLHAQRVGQETASERQRNTDDDQPVREFVESKENIEIKEKAQNLEISGDVRFEWRTIQEKGVVPYVPSSDYNSDYILTSPISDLGSLPKKYRGLRGGSHVDPDNLPISTNDFDVEFNLKVKYNYKKAWAAAHLQFDNPAGVRIGNNCITDYAVFNDNGSMVILEKPRDTRQSIKGSGAGLFVNLKRAYMGYNAWADGKHRFDIELGRRKFDDIFVSEIEFSSRFDGVLFKFATALEEKADLYMNTGIFVVDERVNHFGWVTEVGVLNIYDIGLDLRYSYIDWRKRGTNRCKIFDPLGTDFQISQVSWAYHFSPTVMDKEIPIEFYGGFLVNHGANPNVFTKGKLKNLGWYGGFYIGKVDQEGDWAIDIEYIAVQAQAVPDLDVKSIGRGNILDLNLQDIIGDLQSSFSGFSASDLRGSYSYPYMSSYSDMDFLGYIPRQGNANFVGWRFEFLYAITDNLTIDVIYEFSNAEDSRIGGRHHFHDFELEAIYAF